MWLLSLLPFGLPYWLGRKGAGLWMKLSPVKRHTTERNLERCYPDMPEEERRELARASIAHYMSTVLETGHNWYRPIDRLYARCDGMDNREAIDGALERGKGLVILAPHFGAWEYLGLYLQNFPKMAILYKPPENPALDKALLDRRKRAGAV